MTTPSFYGAGGDLNSGPHVFTASVSLTELSPKPTEHFLGYCCESTDVETQVPRGPTAISEPQQTLFDSEECVEVRPGLYHSEHLT